MFNLNSSHLDSSHFNWLKLLAMAPTFISLHWVSRSFVGFFWQVHEENTRWKQNLWWLKFHSKRIYKNLGFESHPKQKKLLETNPQEYSVGSIAPEEKQSGKNKSLWWVQLPPKTNVQEVITLGGFNPTKRKNRVEAKTTRTLGSNITQNKSTRS